MVNENKNENEIQPDDTPSKVVDKLVKRGLVLPEDKEPALLVLTWAKLGEKKAKEVASEKVYQTFVDSGFVDEEGKLIAGPNGPDAMWFLMALQGAKGELDVHDMVAEA